MAIDPVHYARRWKILAVLSLSLLIIGLDNTILNVALPSLQEEFDASNSTLQWIVDSYLLVFAGLLLTLGTFGDRFGRRLALQTGLVIFGGASLAVLVVDSSTELIAVRAAMGIGGALIMPATLSIIANTFPKEERAKAIGIWSATASVGIGLGPLLGGLLLEWFDWSSVFLVNVPVCIAALALGLRWIPESRDPHPGRLDLPGVLLSVLALGTLVYGIIEAPERGWTDPAVRGCFGFALALGVAFVVHELRVPEPMLDLSFFRDPRFSVASLGIGLASFALFGSIFALTQNLQDARGYSALEAGAAMVPVALGLVAGAGSSMQLQKRRQLPLQYYAHARLITYLEWPGHGEAMVGFNGWDPAILDKVRNHEQLKTMADRNADQSFHRAEFLRVTEVLPDELVESAAAIGSVERVWICSGSTGMRVSTRSRCTGVLRRSTHGSSKAWSNQGASV